MKIRWWHIGLFIALILAILSPLASSSPDGLEKVAEDHGFIDTAREAPYHLIGHYLFPGIANETVATILSGIIGTVLIFALSYGLAKIIKKLRRGETRQQN